MHAILRHCHVARLARSWTNVTWTWATKQDLYSKYDPCGTNPTGRQYADGLMDGARTKAHPQKKSDPNFKMFRVMASMEEGTYNANEHFSGVSSSMNAADSKEGAAGVFQACVHIHYLPVLRLVSDMATLHQAILMESHFSILFILFVFAITRPVIPTHASLGPPYDFCLELVQKPAATGSMTFIVSMMSV